MAHTHGVAGQVDGRECTNRVKKEIEAGRSGSRLSSQHFGRLRRVDHRSGVQDQLGQDGETVSTKNTKISQVWWCAPATQEAEAGLLEPGRQRLQ